jgi:hypothetical protein
MDAGIANLFGVFLAMGVSGGICVGMILLFKALAARVERRSGEDLSSLNERISELEQAQLGQLEIEPLASRVAELEERVDFAERLLSQGGEPERLR